MYYFSVICGQPSNPRSVRPQCMSCVLIQGITIARSVFPIISTVLRVSYPLIRCRIPCCFSLSLTFSLTLSRATDRRVDQLLSWIMLKRYGIKRMRYHFPLAFLIPKMHDVRFGSQLESVKSVSGLPQRCTTCALDRS